MMHEGSVQNASPSIELSEYSQHGYDSDSSTKSLLNNHDKHNNHNLSKSRSPFEQAILWCLIAFIITFLVCFSIPYGLSNISCANILDSTYTTPFLADTSTVLLNSSRQYEIVLFGDSMIGYPDSRYQLSKKIESYLPQFNLNVSARGYSGSGISALHGSWLERVLANTTVRGHIDAMIMLWDSDVSDENWYISREDKLAKQAKYIRLTGIVIRRILTAKPGIFLAIAGPLMYGEGPLFAPLRRYDHIYDYRMYSQMYDEYGAINKALCEGHNITYIDVRSAFLRIQQTTMRQGFRGCLTDNGQHENDRGATVVAREFAAALLSSYQRKAPLWS